MMDGIMLLGDNPRVVCKSRRAANGAINVYTNLYISLSLSMGASDRDFPLFLMLMTGGGGGGWFRMLCGVRQKRARVRERTQREEVHARQRRRRQVEMRNVCVSVCSVQIFAQRIGWANKTNAIRGMAEVDALAGRWLGRETSTRALSTMICGWIFYIWTEYKWLASLGHWMWSVGP